MSGPIIYMIRHGEKPAKLPDGRDPVGLSDVGKERAKYLPKVFGVRSPHKIGCLLAEERKNHGKDARPFETVTPLASSLNLSVNASIARDDVQAAANAAKAWSGPGNVLVCWEHHELGKVAEALGVKGYAPETGWQSEVLYPDDQFDLIWTVPPPYDTVMGVGSEQVSGLDDGLSGLPSGA